MATTMTKTKHKPHRPCLFSVGQLVTCAGPFNSGHDDQGYWRRVGQVEGIRWEPSSRGFKGRLRPGMWRVAVPGYSGSDLDFSPASEGTKIGDIIRIGG